MPDPGEDVERVREALPTCAHGCDQFCPHAALDRIVAERDEAVAVLGAIRDECDDTGGEFWEGTNLETSDRMRAFLGGPRASGEEVSSALLPDAPGSSSAANPSIPPPAANTDKAGGERSVECPNGRPWQDGHPHTTRGLCWPDDEPAPLSAPSIPPPTRWDLDANDPHYADLNTSIPPPTEPRNPRDDADPTDDLSDWPDAVPPTPERCPTCGSGNERWWVKFSDDRIIRALHGNGGLLASGWVACPDPWHTTSVGEPEGR